VPTVYLQGQNYSGTTAITATVTASAAGYTSGNGTMSLYPSGLGFSSASFSTTTFSSPTGLGVALLMLNPGTLSVNSFGNLGPQGVSPAFTVTSGTPGTGTISGSPSSFAVNGGSSNSPAITFVPVAQGTSTITLTQPSGYSASTSATYPTQITATVTAAAITVSPAFVGNNFITPLSLTLQAPPPSTETMTVTSSDPTHFLLSTSPTVLGTTSVTVTLTGGSANVPLVYLQGLNYSGNTAITTSIDASAPGFTSGSGTVSLYPSGLAFGTASFSTTTSSSPTTLSVDLLMLNPGSLTTNSFGNLGPQAVSPAFTVTSGTPATGTIAGNPSNFTVNAGPGNTSTLTFVPVAAGTSTLTLNQPAGYFVTTTTSWPSQITATVGP